MKKTKELDILMLNLYKKNFTVFLASITTEQGEAPLLPLFCFS